MAPMKPSARARYRVGTRNSRQLTLGEVLALSRYGQHYVRRDGSIDLGTLVRFIDQLRVCTTCGWPVHIHELSPSERKEVGCCPHYVYR